MATGLILVQVWISWVFFRATTFDQAITIVGRMFSFEGGLDSLRPLLGGTALINLIVIVGAMILRESYFYFGLHERTLMRDPWKRWLEHLALAAVIAACVHFRGPGGAFIYFQF